jgi:hypothetical protein
MFTEQKRYRSRSARAAKRAFTSFAGLIFAVGGGLLTAASTVTISPAGATLGPSQQVAFSAQMNAASGFAAALPTAAWSINPAVGTISASGVYTAPAVISTSQQITIAASAGIFFVRATGTITLVPAAPVAVTVTPGTASVTPSQVQSLTATVTGAVNSGVTWSMNSAVGSLSTAGNTAAYTAPGIINTPQTVTVTAKSMADPTKTASVLISLIPMVALAMSPSTATLDPGATQQFTTAVSGTTNTAVKWSLQPAVGTISPTGLYTAPASVQVAQDVVVTGTSVQDPTKVTTSRLRLNTGVTFAMGSTGLTALAYNGQSMLYPGHGNPAFVQVSVTDPAGNVTAASTAASSVVASAKASSVTATYAWGVATTKYQASGNKMSFTVTIQNTTASKTINHIWMFPVGLQFPSTPQNYSNNMAFNVDAPSSVWWNYGSGSVDLVNEDVVAPLGLGFWQAQNPAGAQWYLMLDTDSGHTLNPNWPVMNRPIAPGGIDTYSVSLRFGGPGLDEPTLAKDIFALYSKTYPRQVKTPTSKKPIAALMVTGKFRPTFPKNPRGWFNDSSIDITTSAGISAFQKRLLSWGDGAVAEMRRVGAQGGILWDIEGQQFDEAYIGDPAQAETIAPELVGVLDAFIAKFTTAGFRIGFTLRPHVFSQKTGFINVAGTKVTWAGGSQFSSDWASLVDSQSIVIGGQNYKIQSVQSPTALTLATSAGTGIAVPFAYAAQANVADPGAVLKAKMQYAKNRWGASLFYVDSDLSWDGGVTSATGFQDLLTSFPDALIFPEWANTRHYAYGMPYLDSTLNRTQAPSNVGYVYPDAVGLVNVPGDAGIAASFNALVQAVRNGNILLFGGWYKHPANDAVIQIYATAGQ